MQTMQNFALHPRLESDTAFIADWALSRVLLMNDARFPWLILVPRRANLNELNDLSHAERMVLIEEIARASRGLTTLAGVDKINVGALGNIVSQLHVHVSHASNPMRRGRDPCGEAARPYRTRKKRATH